MNKYDVEICFITKFAVEPKSYMKKNIYLLLIPIVFGFTLHKFHLSNTKIIHNKDSKTLQVTMRCFVDDIESAINKLDTVVLELGNDRELKKSKKHLKSYVKNNFSIWIDSNKVDLTYIGKEVEKDIVFFYLESDSIKTVSNLKVENKILLTEFEDQKNIIRLEINDKKKTFILKNNNSSEDFDF